MAKSEVVYLEIASAGKQDTDRSEMEPADALTMILSGQAQLAMTRCEAPASLLGDMLTRIGRLDTLGPQAPSGDSGRKIVDRLLPYGTREEYVDGHELHWHQGEDSLENLGKNCWVKADKRQPHIADQLRSLFHTNVALHKSYIASSRPSFDDMRLERIIDPPCLALADPVSNFKFYRLSPVWFDFHLNRLEIESRVRTTIARGLVDGRILAFEERGSVAVRLPPGRDISAHPRDRCWYILTRDLPAAWFKTSLDINVARANALAWLRRAGKFYAKEGMRVTRSFAIQAMQERYELTAYAATRIWDANEHPSKGKPGQIPRGKKVSYEDLVSIA